MAVDTRSEKMRIGDKGEKKARKHLKKQGYKILEKNLKTPFCEVDIVALKGDTIAFIEVKTRTSDCFGTPQEAVDANRQNRYRRAAKYYLMKSTQEYLILFDIIEVFPNEKWRINHIVNAF